MIDEILERLLAVEPESDEGERTELITAKAQLLAEILKVIGEDEEYPTNKIRQNSINLYRNQLRVELRTKLEQLFNVKEK